jgi:hypothetical protein
MATNMPEAKGGQNMKARRMIVLMLLFTVLAGIGGASAAAIDSDSTDDWAKVEVGQAIEEGLVPDSIAKAGWTKPATREMAAEVLAMTIEKVIGKTKEEIVGEKGWSQDQFADTTNPEVTFLKAAGVVTGVGDNKYDPDGNYTREQTVTMMGRITEIFFEVTMSGDNPYSDVASWASSYVGYASQMGITKGIGEGLFGGTQVVSNQQLVIFSLRAFRAWSRKGPSAVEMATWLQEHSADFTIGTSKKVLDDVGGIHDEAWWHQQATIEERILIMTIGSRWNCNLDPEDYLADIRQKVAATNGTAAKIREIEFWEYIAAEIFVPPSASGDGTRKEALEIVYGWTQKFN